jgi:hypothetical protein
VGQSCAVFSRSLEDVGDVTTVELSKNSTPDKKDIEVDEWLKKIDEEKVRDRMELDALVNEQVRQKWEEIEGVPSSLSRQSDQSENNM